MTIGVILMKLYEVRSMGYIYLPSGQSKHTHLLEEIKNRILSNKNAVIISKCMDFDSAHL